MTAITKLHFSNFVQFFVIYYLLCMVILISFFLKPWRKVNTTQSGVWKSHTFLQCCMDRLAMTSFVIYSCMFLYWSMRSCMVMLSPYFPANMFLHGSSYSDLILYDSEFHKVDIFLVKEYIILPF